jgi:hypothetical protein
MERGDAAEHAVVACDALGDAHGLVPQRLATFFISVTPAQAGVHGVQRGVPTALREGSADIARRRN